MAGFVPRNRAESALRFLPQKVALFEPFHAANHLLMIRDFMDHMERDDVLMHVTAAIRRRGEITGKAWYDDSVKAGAARPLPEDALAALALRLDVLKQVRLEKVDLRYFAANLYPGEHLNERLMNWKRSIVHPLCADVRALAKVLLEKLPADERFDMEDLASDALDELRPSAFGPRAWTDKDDEASEGAEKLEAALDALEKAVRDSSELSDEERHDLALEAKILAVDVRRGRKERAKPKLDALAKKKPLASAVEEVRKRL